MRPAPGVMYKITESDSGIGTALTIGAFGSEGLDNKNLYIKSREKK